MPRQGFSSPLTHAGTETQEGRCRAAVPPGALEAQSQNRAAPLRPLFSLFFPEIFSERCLVNGRNPGPSRVQGRKEQRRLSLFFAVFCCSWCARPADKKAQQMDCLTSSEEDRLVNIACNDNITTKSICQFEYPPLLAEGVCFDQGTP